MLIDLHLPRLLLWLDDEGRRNPGFYAELGTFAADEGLDSPFVGNLVTILEQQGLVQVARTLGSGEMPDSLITDLGRVEARRLRERRADPVARIRYARDTLITWLFAGYRTSAANVEDFLVSPESYFLGDQLSVDEVVDAIDYLTARNMITAERRHDGLRLTADGIDCAMSGGSVSDYQATRQPNSGTTYNVTGAPGSIIGGTHGTVNQTNTFGFNPDQVAQLATLAALVRQIGPTLGLPGDETEQLVEGAQALELETTAAAPDQGRLRQAADRLMSGLGTATHATAALTMLVDQGRAAYTAVFGS